jgi:hypothetical protein
MTVDDASGEDPETGAVEDEPDAADADAADADAADELGLSPDLAFDLLKNERRRRVLHYLADADGQVTLGDLAEHIAALENDTTVQALTSTERKRVYVGLYQVHLPKMDDAGVVTFDRNRGTVEADEHAETLTAYLDRDEDGGRPWHRYYGGISAGSAGLYAGSLAGVLPTNLVMGVILTLFIGCSGLHTLEQRANA